jgi:hypothetical protein
VYPSPSEPLNEGSPADAFGHGYLLLGPEAPLPDHAADWPQHTVQGLRYLCHPRTVLTVAAGGLPGISVVLVGHPVDTESAQESIDPRVIGQRALAELARDEQAFVRYVGLLGGRFTAFAHRDATVLAVPDTCAMQSIFYGGTGARTAVASHVELVARAVGAEVDEEAISLVRGIKTFRKGSSTYFAGVSTAYRGVRPVIANCHLTWESRTGGFAHERFYPWRGIEPGGVEEVYPLFRERFDRYCRLLTGFGRTGLSLTCGDDSRTSLFGVLPHLRDDSFAFTYYNPNLRTTNHLDDLFVSSRLAFDLGLAHKVVYSRPPEEGDLFQRVFTTTWSAYTPYAAAACGMYESVPRDTIHLQSTLAEVATTSVLRRGPAGPDARTMAGKFQKGAERRAGYPEAFEEFIAATQFEPSRLGDHDWHDLFYWESRLTRWTAQKAHEGDLAQRVLHPFNSRPLLETMFRLPLERRQDKTLLLRTIDEGARAAGVRP